MNINLSSKIQVTELVENERMIGLMNNSKWNSLFSELDGIDELISYRISYVDGSTWPEESDASPYTTELAQIWGNFVAIEYIDIDARVSYSRGNLLKPDIVDHREKVISICKRNKAKFSLENDVVRIWGYFRQGNQPKLYEDI